MVVEHNLSVVRELADRVVVLDGGRVIADGTPAEVAADDRVRTAYFGDSAGMTLTSSVVAARRRCSPAAAGTPAAARIAHVVVNAPFSRTPYLGRSIENGARLAASEVNATGIRVGDARTT